ncbi:MAG: hypothetical protein U9R74_06370 [Pseudomonadota bacterium]|nr:hypothetical protein [Pseudomonadota bacterium]
MPAPVMGESPDILENRRSQPAAPLDALPHPDDLDFDYLVRLKRDHAALSLLLERVIEHAAEDIWRNIRDDLKQIQLAQLLSPNGTVWQVTEPKSEAAKRLKMLKLEPPKPMIDLL